MSSRHSLSVRAGGKSGAAARGARSTQFHTAGRADRAVTASLTWWGHSTTTWQDDGTTVLFDPVLTARLGHLRRVRGSIPPPHAAHADIVLISHLHADHTHLPSLRLVPASAVLVAPAGSRRLLKPIAARGLKLGEVEPGDLVEFGGLQIRVLAADHDGRRHPGSPYRGPALATLLPAPTDAGPRGTQVRELGFEEVKQVDIALVPAGVGGPPSVGVISMPSSGRGDPLHSPGSCRSSPLGNLVARRPSPAHRSVRLPAAAFAAQVVRMAPATSVHVLRHGQSLRL